ncbi:MAG TPA: formate dehydrogenase subunit alpha [Fimbriimonadaceae bacterium]|nr:formate dehydrogenase subunit alpha [Fimbriimonadaceae bacterium]
MPRLSINGKENDFREGESLLDVIRGAGIDIPTLCHDDRLKPFGGCRLCMVEVDQGRLVTACTTQAAEGMKVETHSSAVESLRRTNLTLLAEGFPADEPLNEHFQFQRYLLQYGIGPRGARSHEFKDDTHPYLRVDMDKCVYCYRCVRICAELQGQFVWRAWNRGERTRILPTRTEGVSPAPDCRGAAADQAPSMLESDCVSCGACADTCPSGAIMDKAIAEKGVPKVWTRTTCPYCGTGCEMEMGSTDGEIIVARPLASAPVNKGHLCVKGRYAHAFVHAKDRVMKPLIRKNGQWEEVSWEDAYHFTASRLHEIIDKHGPQAVGVLGSARASNEENYLAQKFSRVVVGSNNVDCCARICHGPTAAALKASFGTGAATNSFNDIEVAAAFLICGANPTENHPIVGARIKQAVLDGARLIVIDPRRTELAAYADVHLQIQPGTNVAILNSIAHVIIEEGLVDRAFVDSRTEEYDRFVDLVQPWTAEQGAKICGVCAEDIRRAARIYAQSSPAMIFHGLGTTEHSQGTEGVRGLANLALLTGNVGKPGSGENPLRGQNNVQGSAHMGCEPSNLAGYTPIAQSAEWVEEVWGRPVPREQGLNWMQMLDASGEGTLKALYAIGYDVYFSNPNSNQTRESLKKLDLVIIQDLFMNETAREFGDVFLPVCSSYEKDGTFMNSERRVQRIRKAIPVLGDSRPDWQVICELAAQMGFAKEFAFESPKDIWNEVRKIWKAGAGISYERIEDGGLQWPCLSEDDPGTTILHRDKFPLGPKAPFSIAEYTPTKEVTNAEFPFLLSTGRTLFQFNAGTMTERTPNVVLRPTDTLDICPADAEELGVQNGQTVRITSRWGSTELPARIDDRIRKGELYATFHDPKVFMNRVTSNYRDGKTGAAEYKVTAVKVERI